MKKTFEEWKTITELWIDTTRKFVVINGETRECEVWDVLTLEEDDDTICPYFTNQYWIKVCPFLHNLYYADEPQEEVKTKNVKPTVESIIFTDGTVYKKDTVFVDNHLYTQEELETEIKELRALARKLSAIKKQHLSLKF